MMGKTHIMWGVFCALVFYYLYSDLFLIFRLYELILIFIFVIFGSVLPDIDHGKSIVGRKIKIIAILFEHRGFFHSILAIVMWYFLFLLLLNKIYVYAILFGYISHLFIDCFNHYGISPFAPFNKFKIKGPFYTNGFVEKIFFLILNIFNILLLFLLVFLNI
ncbi:metal-dependent hydrolase [Candidatus Woesearchaeota archaeon]|jgi:inner membrane protein|nr:metal-dependent hydrolase [Candidatus Woesearchaeota archaeon]MBT4387309.1 metal-dependent hydrolase [Candidatus Woesearchaeota archaeon]MBT4595448.1 metal-dependent hydrolase [Candidatus Woesearchaeota archaeon]MBT5741163.1 metal-dependent hydrolase [Candidatus Woesearchaeota archaeon]MBT6505929.1 metal-dependent hydrolase [Candidatus Woesearchaeota archaeon]